MQDKKFYLTTPLYYVNAKPHIGHSYTNIAADALARFWRLSGRNVFFLTGTDEHGQKIFRAAQAAGMEPGPFTDKISETFRDLWKKLNIHYDRFIRTTEADHKVAVQAVWRELDQKGEIYTSTYEGYYCTHCENFLTNETVRALGAGGKIVCPDCGRPAEKIKEDNYFFRISKYQDWLTAVVRNNPGFIQPEIRRNEVLGFLNNNKLEDLCISRPKNRLGWGIESPLSAQHVTYVWFDALINYISACGFPDRAKMKKWWPADVHIIGKDILRHHAVYWPILLHALGLELPQRVFAHGWWVEGGEKMSKSKGNVIDPVDIVNRFGVDAYRYFLLRETPFGQDGVFSEEAFILRYNTDLANDLGNLVHRTLTMCEKYFEGKVPEKASLTSRSALRKGSEDLPARLSPLMEKLSFSEALSEIWALTNEANKYIEDSAPWKLSKEKKTEALGRVMVELLETLKMVSQAVWPFMPATAEAIWKQLGIETPIEKAPFKEKMWGFFERGGRISKGAPLFPRIELKKT